MSDPGGSSFRLDSVDPRGNWCGWISGIRWFLEPREEPWFFGFGFGVRRDVYYYYHLVNCNNLWLLGSYSVDIPTKEPCRQAETMEVPSNLNGWMSSRSGSRLGAPFVVLCIQVRRDLDPVDERNKMR